MTAARGQETQAGRGTTDHTLSVCAVRPGKVAISSGFEPRPGKVGQPPGSESLEGGE